MLFDPNWQPKPDIKHPDIKRKNLGEKQLEALLWLRNALDTGLISARHFRMDTTVSEGTCGAVGCIAGWMAMHRMKQDGLSDSDIVKIAREWDETPDEAYSRKAMKYETYLDRLLNNDKFSGLFYMANYFPNHSRRTGKVLPPTRKQAVKAIDLFLAGEDYPWNVLFPPSPPHVIGIGRVYHAF